MNALGFDLHPGTLDSGLFYGYDDLILPYSRNTQAFHGGKPLCGKVLDTFSLRMAWLVKYEYVENDLSALLTALLKIIPKDRS